MIISALWCEVLKTTETPALHDNFFELGGDSMAMVTLEFRIQEELGVSLTPGTLIAASTLEELTAVVNRLLQRTTYDNAPVSAEQSSAQR